MTKPKDPELVAFGRKVYTLRRVQRPRMSQGKVAEYIGVTRWEVARWEHGEHEPKGKHVRALARLFDVDADTLWPASNRPL